MVLLAVKSTMFLMGEIMIFYISYIILYFAMMFGIGIRHMRKVKTADDYLIAGRTVRFWPLVGTILSTWCGASVFIGSMGMGNSVGISGYFKFTFPAALVSIIFVYFFATPLHRQKICTLSDLFCERFGIEAGIFPSLLSAFGYAVPTAAMQIAGMTTIWTAIFGMDKLQGLLLSFVLITGFTVLGGLPATIITDAIQALIIILGLGVLLASSLHYAGSLETVIAQTPPALLSPVGPYGMSEVLLYSLSIAPFYMVWQST